ncbi:hypothetical protein F2Q70_00015595 [Brassica cretica]|uniref:Protein kinase domain-containing protein n=1 Tax=Brassica cretica TaxID=69181 RepID=A0A3N6TL31_BRACR|nr:hypothetical protein F2Q70_00015595 [Brassica cretica]KAF2596017.1 hypothetical protein F2Q68_00008539 [Brassica cretica]
MMKIRTEKQLLQRNQLQNKARIEARMNLNDDKVERFDVPPGQDLKTANILLDHGYKPKLSDIGLAKFGPSGDMSHVSNRVMGSHGYCAPEFAILGEVDILFGDEAFEAAVQNLISSSPVKNSRRLIPKIIHCFWSARIELLVG